MFKFERLRKGAFSTLQLGILLLPPCAVFADEPQRELLWPDGAPGAKGEDPVNDMPPTFLFHTDEDTGVPAENSVAFYLALRKAGVPAELHVYRMGGHGVNLARNIPGTSAWPEACEQWLKGLGLLKSTK